MNRKNKALFVGLIGTALVCLGFGIPVQRQLTQGRKNRELVVAIRKGEVDRAIALVEAGVDPNCPVDDSPPLTFWQTLWQMLSPRQQKIVPSSTSFLIANEYVQWHPPRGVKLADADVARLDEVMLSHGANVNASRSDEWRSSALWYAAEFHRLQTAKVLLVHHADVNQAGSKGWTPLMMALWARDIPIAKLLLQHNADVNVILSDGRTALSMLVNDDTNLPLTQELLKHKADVNHCDQYGATPLKIAQQHKAWGMVKLLQEAGAKQ